MANLEADNMLDENFGQAYLDEDDDWRGRYMESKIKYYRCPGCGEPQTSSDLLYTEGACINFESPDLKTNCDWTDPLDEISEEEYQLALKERYKK